MKGLTILNGELVMTSLEIADLTGKRHADVLRDISNMLNGLGNERKTALVEYTDKKARSASCIG